MNFNNLDTKYGQAANMENSTLYFQPMYEE